MNASKTLYAFDLCGAYPVPGGNMLVYNPRNGRHAALTPDVYGTLLFCRSFHTLEDHVTRIIEANPALQGQEADVLGVLQHIQADGLMVSADVYSVMLQPAAQPKVNLDKPVVAVITWERPESLERCLESLREHCDTDNFDQLVIIDDSRTESAQSRNRTITDQFSHQIDARVRYFGAEEQQALLDAMISQVPSIEPQVRFLIDRERWADYWTSGLARTVALLLSVGKRLVVLDDDIVCQIHDPDIEPRITFGDVPREVRFYEGKEAWEEPAAEKATDPILRHLMVLGSSLEDALGTLGIRSCEPASFEGADIEALEKLHSDSQVLMTECGSIGDAGTGDLNWLPNIEGESLERLIEDESSVDKAFSFRSCWNGAGQLRVQPRANMSQLTGLDHRTLLPPYTPILRGEDELFGTMVRTLHPESVVFDQPWAIEHLPIPEREWSEQQKTFQVGANFEALGMRWLERHREDVTGKDPVRRLNRMASVYDTLIEKDDAAMRDAFTDQLLTDRSANLRMMASAIERAGPEAPEVWRKFLLEGQERLNAAIVNNPIDREITGYPRSLKNEALMEFWREYWREFSQALRVWPSIRQAARQVSEHIGKVTF